MIYLILNDHAFLQLKNVPEYIVPETLKKMSGMERNKNKEVFADKMGNNRVRSKGSKGKQLGVGLVS